MFTLKDGSVSAHGLACGYIDRDTRKTVSGRSVRIDLSFNGCTYDVDVMPISDRGEIEPRGMVSQLCGLDCDHSATTGHASFTEGWAQFDNLTEARKFKRKLMRANTVADIMVACAGAMLDDGLVAGYPESSIRA